MPIVEPSWRVKRYLELREKYRAADSFLTDPMGEEEDKIFAELERMSKELTAEEREFIILYDTEF